MAVVVQKFGGSSVANAERIMHAARRAVRAKQAGNQVVVVVSARGDTTDDLIELASEISENPPAREMDMLLATGEQISIALMAMAIQELGEASRSGVTQRLPVVRRGDCDRGSGRRPRRPHSDPAARPGTR